MKNSNKKGFTLVELVVVIAIIGVLAAILVPSMMGYVKKSRLKTANGNAKTAYNTAAGALADLETNGVQVTSLAISNSDCTAGATPADIDTITTEADGQKYVEDVVKQALGANGADGGFVSISGKTTSDATADEVWTAWWHKKKNDKLCGRYPEAFSTVEKAEAGYKDFPGGES